MAAELQVLLLEDIPNVGRAGDIVSVSEGYARNALFPQGKAALATKSVKRESQAKNAAKQKQEEEQLREFQALAEKMENTEIVISAKIKDGDEIFGSVTAKQVVDALQEQADVALSPKQIIGDFPIKKAGVHDITVALGQGIEFFMKLSVEGEAQHTEDE